MYQVSKNRDEDFFNLKIYLFDKKNYLWKLQTSNTTREYHLTQEVITILLDTIAPENLKNV